MGILDDLFEDLTKDPEQEEQKPGAEGGEAPPPAGDDDGEDDDKPQKQSPLFPTGKAWDDFKKERNGAV